MSKHTAITKSAIVSSYEYDDKSLVLKVTFTNNQVWQYINVFPNVITQVFDEPGSVGSKFIKLIKHGGYLGTKLI